jgi:TubC N-terminal docking domain
MTARDILQQCHELGVNLMPSPDGMIRCRASKGVLTPTFLNTIRQHKLELLALLAQSTPAHDTAATEPNPLEACTHQEYVPPPPPPYLVHPMGAHFHPGQQVWLYRWDNHTPRFNTPVTIVQMRTLWPGEQDIGWCNAAGELTWHNARLAIPVET